MDNPSTEMRWGGGKWKTGHKKAVRPYVESALELTDCAMAYLEVSSSVNRTATVYRALDNFTYLGSAIDPQNFEVYIKNKDIIRNRVGRNLGVLATTAIHENMHCIRMEKSGFSSSDSLVECVASEGISYWSEYIIAKEILNSKEIDCEYGELFSPMDDSVYSQLKGHLAYDEGLDFSDEVYGIWFDGTGQSGVSSAGNRLGVVAVGNLLEKGANLSDVLNMHAAEIIGID